MRYFHLVILILLTGISCSDSNGPDSEAVLVEMEEAQMTMEEMDGLSGEFITAAHTTTGTAIVNENRTQLELIAFNSDDGPLLELYLATDLNATDYLSLGELQGLEGDFVYDLPNNINFETHKYLMVWCVDFSVNFGHAILE